MPKNKRKAIDCKLIEPSKTSPGYFKYLITIEEVDGMVHSVPAYGKDMQDAINRLIWTERYEVAADSKILTPFIVALFAVIIILSGFYSGYKNQPIWVLLSIGVSVMFLVTLSRVEKYLKK
jgi:hypothetical protein